MELTLEGHPSMHAEGPVTIELPSYFTVLRPAELEEARTADNRAELVMASGRHPNGDILFLTGDGTLWELSVESQREHGLPAANVRVVPIDHGQTLHYVMTGSYEIASDWAIDHSIHLLALGTLGPGRVTYEDEGDS